MLVVRDVAALDAVVPATVTKPTTPSKVASVAAIGRVLPSCTRNDDTALLSRISHPLPRVRPRAGRARISAAGLRCGRLGHSVLA